MPGRPGHEVDVEGHVFDSDTGEELPWQYSKPGTSPFVHLKREKDASLRCQLKRSSSVRRVVACAFGLWPPPLEGGFPTRRLQLSSVDGSHHPDALIYVCAGDARRIAAAHKSPTARVAVDDVTRAVKLPGARNASEIRLVVPVSKRPDAWSELARRAPDEPRPPLES